MMKFTQEQQQVIRRYPFRATDYYLSLINPDDPNDPIARQIMPDGAELLDLDSSFDPLGENQHLATSRLVHRYQDRALLLTTGNCPVRCRFCLRKRFWCAGEADCPDIDDVQLDEAVDYLSKHPEIRELLLSGGDPLSLSNQRIDDILKKVHAIPHLDVIRLATRTPVVQPARFDDRLFEILGQYPKLWVMTHFNHPRELTEESTNVTTRLNQLGVIVLNQTVLLAGVNDDPETLITLFQALVRHRIKPHYLFHVDPVQGVRHFATGIEKGLQLMRAFRGRLSSLATPSFAIDLPDGGGKVLLQPDYRLSDHTYPDIENSRAIPYQDLLP